jgi:outer membrane protein assembly factor BamB
MKLSVPVTLLLLSAALTWTACGSNEAAPPSQSKLPVAGRNLQLTDEAFGAPKSVIRDGDFYYVSNVGAKPEPFKKDGDGYIVKLDREGQVVDRRFIAGLEAPKGSAIIDGTFYVADIDRVKAFDLATGQPQGEVDFSSTGTQFLNDLVVVNGELIVSATDINKLYTIDLTQQRFEELITQPTLQRPSGLSYHSRSRILYAVTYPRNPEGKLYAIDLGQAAADTHKATRVSDYAGTLDGLALVGDYALVSDWHRQTVVVINTSTGEVSGSGLENLVEGPADLYFDQERGEFWVPSMMGNRIDVHTLPVITQAQATVRR